MHTIKKEKFKQLCMFG